MVHFSTFFVHIPTLSLVNRYAEISCSAYSNLPWLSYIIVLYIEKSPSPPSLRFILLPCNRTKRLTTKGNMVLFYLSLLISRLYESHGFSEPYELSKIYTPKSFPSSISSSTCLLFVNSHRLISAWKVESQDYCRAGWSKALRTVKKTKNLSIRDRQDI